MISYHIHALPYMKGNIKDTILHFDFFNLTIYAKVHSHKFVEIFLLHFYIAA